MLVPLSGGAREPTGASPATSRSIFWFGKLTQATETRSVQALAAFVTVRVYRQRGALLSRLAHDLELRLEELRLDTSESHVEVDFELGSLKVTGALVNGRLDESQLNAAQRGEIEHNMHGAVLKTRSHPRGHFSGQLETLEESVRVEGQLELVGVKQALNFELRRQGTQFIGSTTIQPSRWGIAPYKALLGALKLEDRVDVQITVAVS
jgi:polyisoprenoid-binding protein YceI